MGSKRAAVVASNKCKRRKVFAHRDFPKGCDRQGRQLSDLSGPDEAPLVENDPTLDPVERSKSNNVDRVEKKEKVGLLKVSAVRRFPGGLRKPDEDPGLSKPEEEEEEEEKEEEALSLEEKDPFLDWIESSEPEHIEDGMESEDVLKGSKDGLGFSDAENLFLSERYNLAKWRRILSKPNNVDQSKDLDRVDKKKYPLLKVSAVRRFPRGLGKPDEELPELSEPEEEEEEEALNLEDENPFLDWIESSEPENTEDRMESEDVLKGSTDGLGFSGAEKLFLSERYNLAEWIWVSSKPNNVDQSKGLDHVDKKKAGLLGVSAIRRFPRGLGKPDEELPQFSEPEEEEEEALTLEEKDPFLDRIESSENMEDEMEPGDVLKGRTNELEFSDAEQRFLSERYNLAKWRWVSAVRDFPAGCGMNSSKPRLKLAVAKKPQFQKPVGCMPSKKIESKMKEEDNGKQMQCRVQETCKENGLKSPSKRSSDERKVVAGSNSERRSKAQQNKPSDSNVRSQSGSEVVGEGNGASVEICEAAQGLR